MIRREDVTLEETIIQRFRLPLPASDPTIRNVTDDVERRWWQMVAEKRIVVTTLPVTTTREVGRNLAATIDAALPQPYGYEPPMDLIIHVEGGGCMDARPTMKG